MKQMKGAGLTEMEFNGKEGIQRQGSALSNAVARETPDHISGTNQTKEYVASNPPKDGLGARKMAGK
jgi:hypothetical protein